MATFIGKTVLGLVAISAYSAIGATAFVQSMGCHDKTQAFSSTFVGISRQQSAQNAKMQCNRPRSTGMYMMFDQLSSAFSDIASTFSGKNK